MTERRLEPKLFSAINFLDDTQSTRIRQTPRAVASVVIEETGYTDRRHGNVSLIGEYPLIIRNIDGEDFYILAFTDITDFF